MLEITYLGHAGFYLEDGDFRLLCDPWDGNNLAYYGTWRLFPSNLNIDWEYYLRRTNYLYISHLHEDHLDKVLIKRLGELNPSIKVIAPPFQYDFYCRQLQKLGLSNQDNYSYNSYFGYKVFTPLSETPDRKKEDSALVVSGPGGSFVSLNDCELDESNIQTIHEIFGDIDIVAGQFSGASWYPICYDLELEAKKEICIEHRLKSIHRFESNPLKAKKLIPCAGPVTLSHVETIGVDNLPPKYSMFPNAWEAEWSADNIYRVLPGDRFTVDTLQDNPNPPAQKSYFLVMDLPFMSWEGARDKFYNQLESLFPIPKWFQNTIKQKLIIEVEDRGHFLLDVKNEELHFSSAECNYSSPYYKITLSEEFFREIVESETTDWENVLLSFRCKLTRKPTDFYDPWLLSLLRNLDPNILTLVAEECQTTDRYENEMITKEGYSFQRYCPHLQFDLSKLGKIDHNNKTITCCGHGYKWDLETGKGINVNCNLKIGEHSGL